MALKRGPICGRNVCLFHLYNIFSAPLKIFYMFPWTLFFNEKLWPNANINKLHWTYLTFIQRLKIKFWYSSLWLYRTIEIFYLSQVIKNNSVHWEGGFAWPTKIFLPQQNNFVVICATKLFCSFIKKNLWGLFVSLTKLFCWCNKNVLLV